MPFHKFLLAALAAVALAACGSESGPEPESVVKGEADEHEEHEGKHDGMVTVIGDHDAHVETVHDLMDGTVTIWLYDGEMNDVEPDAPPVLNLKLDEGTTKLVGVAKEGAWVFAHEEFEGGHPSGRFLFKIGGKTYTPEFLHAH